MNHVSLTGTVVYDIKISKTVKGKTYARFTLCTQNGKDNKITHTCCIWDETLAETLIGVNIGSHLHLEGYMRNREHDGKKYYEIIGEQIDILSNNYEKDEIKEIINSSNVAKDDIPF